MPNRYLLLPSSAKYNIANMCTVNMDNFGALYPCPDVKGTLTERYCCQDLSNLNACCEGQIVTIPLGGPSLFLPHGDISFDNATSPLSLSSAMSSSVASLSTSAYALATSLAYALQSASSADTEPSAQTEPSARPAPSAQPTPLCRPSPSSKLPLSIGAGIGVPLAVLLFSAQSFLLFREHRRRTSAEKAMVENNAANPRRYIVGTGDLHELHGRSTPGEVEYAHRQPGERYTGEIYEVGGSPRFREPPGNNSREDGERL
ncbi:hypothetical protein N7G274_009890 [Stereocaulon virgatum]|uniref:Uncharacterized protein n=1 Tax=Stereocaulon virgatum TaxID=373712 RepID=A0ABR3ZW62_9LECA